jgi:hypothetical protein
MEFCNTDLGNSVFTTESSGELFIVTKYIFRSFSVITTKRKDFVLSYSKKVKLRIKSLYTSRVLKGAGDAGENNIIFCPSLRNNNSY